jgi:hypothetical protein
MEWLKVKALSSSYITIKKKKSHIARNELHVIILPSLNWKIGL